MTENNVERIRKYIQIIRRFVNFGSQEYNLAVKDLYDEMSRRFWGSPDRSKVSLSGNCVYFRGLPFYVPSKNVSYYHNLGVVSLNEHSDSYKLQRRQNTYVNAHRTVANMNGFVESTLVYLLHEGSGYNPKKYLLKHKVICLDFEKSLDDDDNQSFFEETGLNDLSNNLYTVDGVRIAIERVRSWEPIDLTNPQYSH